MEKVDRPSVLLSWLLATRPKTLTASFVPFIAGTILAYSTGAAINWFLFFSALGAALYIQFAVNLLNDAFDHTKGADSDRRLGPRRVLHAGLATRQQVYFAGISCLLLAFITAIPLIYHGGVMFLIIILFSMLSAYIYTGGPYALAYCGLGDIFVIIFYGWVATLSAYWLQAGNLSGLAILLGTQIGLLCTVLIAINNLRDIEEDAKSAKNTLAVRFGPTFARLEIAVLTIAPFLMNFIWLIYGYSFAATLPWLLFPLALALVVKIFHTPPSQEYNKFLGFAALLHLGFGALLSLGFLLHF